MPDPILLWNEVALEANRVSHTNGQGEQGGPTLSSRALAIVHLAMYDAYAAVDAGAALPPYQPGLPAAPAIPIGSSVAEVASSAVAAAAHTTLSALYPSQQPFFNSILAGAGDVANIGHAFGRSVAQALLLDRKNDPGVGSVTYKPSTARGKHRPDPDNPGQGFYSPDYGRLSKGFAIGARHALAAPPFNNAEYKKALLQVRGKGIRPEQAGMLPNAIAKRTVDESLIGTYWAYDGVAQLGTPPRFYNQIIREVAMTRGNTVAQNAQLFALVNAAMGDAGILGWEQKYLHEFWRPVVGVREHDRSIGPGAIQGVNNISNDGDPFWLPWGSPNTNRIAKNFTPNFPAYPSGHATFGAAAFHIARLFYGQGGRYDDETLGPDDLFANLSFVSDELNGINTDNTGTVRPRHLRAFPGGLWQMIEENARSRVYLGVHWIFDAFAVKANGHPDGDPDLYRTGENDLPFGGVPLGLTIAEDIFGRAQQANWQSSVGPAPQPLAAAVAAADAPAGERSETFAGHYQPTAS